MLTGAIIGAIIGLLTALLIAYSKQQRFNKLLKTISTPEYAGLYHYATYNRFGKSLKFYDSYGLLSIAGNTLLYKAKENETPLQLDLAQCTVQREEDWRKMKWFSITTPVGEKHFFNSHKTGFLVNNSDETLKGLAFIQSKISKANSERVSSS